MTSGASFFFRSLPLRPLTPGRREGTRLRLPFRVPVVSVSRPVGEASETTRQDHRWVDEGHEEFVQGYGSGSQAGPWSWSPCHRDENGDRLGWPREVGELGW